MCSICGIIKNSDLTTSEVGHVAKMNDALTHRGPNDSGRFSARKIEMAMRRLSIIDLAGGQQPFFNEDKTLALIVNGEIYNYIELREELQAKGHLFTTASDCETLVHAYEEYGDDFLHHIRGMFAFCLYDKKKNKVILGRDRLGEKPIYLYETSEMIAFASELKALIPLIPKEERVLNYNAIYAYFFYQYIPEPHTAIRGIRKLPPATILEINLSEFSKTERRYWSMHSVPPIHGNHKKIIRGALNDIEKIIIRSDVPVGISLSGGIDSSVIAILSARYKKNLHAFSVGYKGVPDNDERDMARSLAQTLGMRFHEIELSEDEFVQDFDTVISALDDPIADIAAYGYYCVSQKAREEGVPVLLAGFGGDELFGGYSWATQAITQNKLRRTFVTRLTLLGKIVFKQKRALITDPIQTIFQALYRSFSRGYIFYNLTPGFSFTQRKQRQMFSRSFLKKVDCEFPYSFFRNEHQDKPEVESVILLQELWMLSNCIPLGDRLSMAHAIELRLPLLDYVLVEQVLGLYKTTDTIPHSKRWLVDAMGDDLPKEIAVRKKRGFTPPTTLWIDRIIQAKRERLRNGYLVRNNILSKAFIEEALSDPRTYQDFLYKVLTLETWIMHYLK